ncbi:hypothetical protein O181_024197 [Austropuccinia psidii MF-1]|uniref:CCHC-type domain-containing protein n=1 Tax=Austropuccinia psidii MF-1 TaxID=1389203 RepID=A0A9Q3GYR0_9BASI|nr:hypothetical protein [Austropuccinia psidii MF-1]
MPEEPEYAVKFRCNQNCTLDDIVNTLKDVRKRTNIGKYSPYKSSGFKDKQPFRVEFKDNPKERVAEVTKKKNLCHNCGSTEHYTNNCPKAKKKVYAIEKVPEDESPTEDSDSHSMGDAIREQSDEDQDPREEFLVEYQGETPLAIQETQLEAGMLQDTANKNLCKHTQDAQTFLVTPTKRMAYIHGTATKITVFIINAQKPLIIDSGAHFSIVARNYLDNHFPNWEKQLFPTKAKNFKSVSGKITSIGTIIKEIIIPHREGNIRLNPEKNKPSFSIGKEPLGKIRGHDIELYLYVGKPYPPILRRPPYPESLETRKEIEKHINELLDLDVIRKIGHNEIVEITTPVLITWNDGKPSLCGDFRALNNCTNAERYPIPRITHALDKLEKAKYITKMDCMKGFHQNGVKPNSINILKIICLEVIYEYTRMPFGIKNAPAHFQRMMDTIFQDEILEGWMVVYIDDIIIYSETWEDHVQYIDRVLSKCTPINLKISLTKCNFGQQELSALGHKVSGFSLAIDQSKVAAVLLKPAPKNIKEMKSFLGIASYYYETTSKTFPT